jgi:hypothetical protein
MAREMLDTWPILRRSEIQRLEMAQWVCRTHSGSIAVVWVSEMNFGHDAAAESAAESRFD